MKFRSPGETDLSRRIALLTLLSVGTSASTSEFAVAGELMAADLPMSLEAKVSNFLENRHKGDMHHTSQQFWSGLNPDELDRLLVRDAADIAMRSAWEFVQRNGASRSSVDQFVEVTRQKLGIEPPQWWEMAIRTARLRSGVSRGLEMNTKLYPKYFRASGDWYLQSNHRLHGKNPELRIVAGKLSVSIPAVAMKERKSVYDRNCLVVEITEQRAFLLCHAGLDSRVPFYCIDPATGDLLWESVIWVGASGISQIGVSRPKTRIGDYSATMVHDAERILVFGADGVRAHVEGFRDTDGGNLFRFCTSI